MESSTVLSFTTKEKMTLKMIFISTHSSPKVKIDGQDVSIVNGEVSMELPAGDHKITKNTNNTFLFYLNLYTSTALPHNIIEGKSAYYDCQGRPIAQPKSGQIVIQEGKKFMYR